MNKNSCKDKGKEDKVVATALVANDTAYANADMNGDGKVDGLDTSALIEDQLGKK